MTYLYDGFHKIEAVNATVNGKKKQYEKLILKDAIAGLVIDQSGNMCLVEQYRPTVGGMTYEIPAGVLDKEGLAPLGVLIEELEEECLIPRKDIIEIDPLMLTKYYMVIGSTDAMIEIHVLRVKDQGKLFIENPSDEVSAIHWFGPCRVNEMLIEGLIQDPKTIIAINHYLSLSRTHDL
ncbi:NUDIX domain-containing protein [Lysinibacillus sp. UGB7]|uniref:NUDIX domain-containing protein n=1 Tax=Lysinibacillus sp. UGB7 TaxID=3411039 RepID=UPI003B772490